MQASAQKRGRALALTLAASRAGNVAALFALGLPILVGITGLGVEAGLWYASKRQLQTAADAAAVAGALERAAGGGVEAAALDAAAKNGASATGGTTVTVNTPPASGPNAGDPTAVEAIVTRHQQALLSGMFLADGLTVSARAVAKVAGKGKACVLALDPTASGAITNLGSATVDLGGCMIAANSIDDTAITFGGNASVTAGSLWTAGN
jgi:Flp pilus assembly protein TadG